jgi:hypothetical protein
MGKTRKRERSFDEDFGKRTDKFATRSKRRKESKVMKTLNSYADYEGEFEDDFELYDDIDIRHND